MNPMISKTSNSLTTVLPQMLKHTDVSSIMEWSVQLDDSDLSV